MRESSPMRRQSSKPSAEHHGACMAVLVLGESIVGAPPNDPMNSGLLWFWLLHGRQGD